jgi:uncharacterized protein YbbK (DUF523 family)
MKVLVSACLLGINSKYNGDNNRNEKVIKFLKNRDIIFYPLCAEQIGGLPTPRKPCEIEKGYTSKDVIKGKARIINTDGKDCTKHFLEGAYNILNFCNEFDISHAILQDRSPSCGYTKVYDGTFKNILKEGNGLLTQLLIDKGIVILDIKNL